MDQIVFVAELVLIWCVWGGGAVPLFCFAGVNQSHNWEPEQIFIYLFTHSFIHSFSTYYMLEATQLWPLPLVDVVWPGRFL